MPVVSPGKTSNPVDRNAVSPDRIRRNWQRLTQGAATDLISLSATGAIIRASDGLAVNVDNDTIVIDGSNQLHATFLSIQQIMSRISLGI